MAKIQGQQSESGAGPDSTNRPPTGNRKADTTSKLPAAMITESDLGRFACFAMQAIIIAAASDSEAPLVDADIAAKAAYTYARAMCDKANMSEAPLKSLKCLR